MKKNHYIVALTLLLVSSVAVAQQESVYTFYRQHMNLVNPAYAGMDNTTLASSTLRKQWTAIEDSPESQALSFSTPLGRNLGIGISLINNKTFIEKQTYFSVDFSYKLKMSETADVYFGIKASGDSYNLNLSGLETYNVQSDPSLASISTFNPNVGLGAVYKEGLLYVSLSIPRLLDTSKAKNNAGYASVATSTPNIYLSGGYDIPLNGEYSSLILKPSVMLRYMSGESTLLNLTTTLQIDKFFEVGAMYRTDKAYAAMASVLISNRLLLGFAYEMSTRATLAAARNTNEIIMQFKF